MNKVIYLDPFQNYTERCVQYLDSSSIVGFILDENFKLYPTYILPNGEEIKTRDLYNGFSHPRRVWIKEYHPRSIYKLFARTQWTSDVLK